MRASPRDLRSDSSGALSPPASADSTRTRHLPHRPRPPQSERSSRPAATMASSRLAPFSARMVRSSTRISSMLESICSQHLDMLMISSNEVDSKIPPTPFAKGGVRGRRCLSPFGKGGRGDFVPHRTAQPAVTGFQWSCMFFCGSPPRRTAMIVAGSHSHKRNTSLPIERRSAPYPADKVIQDDGLHP